MKYLVCIGLFLFSLSSSAQRMDLIDYNYGKPDLHLPENKAPHDKTLSNAYVIAATGMGLQLAGVAMLAYGSAKDPGLMVGGSVFLGTGFALNIGAIALFVKSDKDRRRSSVQ